jgi:hypothetical protein
MSSTRGGPLFVIVYVDDITILGKSLQAVQRLKSDLSDLSTLSDSMDIQTEITDS